jgi:nucleoside-diphosphate-sugar epimerase
MTTATANAGQSGPATLLGTSVVVTGASGFVGRRLTEALAETSARTVALVGRPCHVPARRVLAGPLDASWAQESLEDADVVVHLAGALHPLGSSYWSANVETAATVAGAVRHGAARRIVFLSYVGASVHDRNEYLRTKAQAELALAATGRELVVLRATHIVGGPDDPGPMAEALRARGDGLVLVPGDGTQPVAPVYVGDVVDALMFAVRGFVEPGTYDLAGPDQMTLEALALLVNHGQARIRHVPERLARLAALFLPSLPTAVVDLMLRPCLGDAASAARAFGIVPRSLRAVWS